MDRPFAEQVWERNQSLKPSDEDLRKWAERGPELAISFTAAAAPAAEMPERHSQRD